VVAAAARDVDRLLALAAESVVPAREIGTVGGDRLDVVMGGDAIQLQVERLRTFWREALPRALDG
jgi:phosphoribosylformylglycinamidine synthase